MYYIGVVRVFSWIGIANKTAISTICELCNALGLKKQWSCQSSYNIYCIKIYYYQYDNRCDQKTILNGACRRMSVFRLLRTLFSYIPARIFLGAFREIRKMISLDKTFFESHKAELSLHVTPENCSNQSRIAHGGSLPSERQQFSTV
jgi:hypothetical protein